MPKPPRVTLIKQVKVNGKWRPATVLFDRKGRVRPDRVRVNGQDEAHTEGGYFIEWCAEPGLADPAEINDTIQTSMEGL